jgi:uncharacterized protein YgiM (DUF1202 family)
LAPFFIEAVRNDWLPFFVLALEYIAVEVLNGRSAQLFSGAILHLACFLLLCIHKNIMKKILLIFVQLLFAFTLGAQTVVKYASANLNLREKPNTDSGIIVVIPRGTEIKVDNYDTDTWILISHQGNIGYVHSKYLTDQKPQNISSTTGEGAKSYANSRGQRIQSPTSYSSAPAGATAKCRDGTYCFSRSRRGTCFGHGGVAQWL